MKIRLDGFLYNPLLYYGAGLVPALLVCTSLKSGLYYGIMLLVSLLFADLLIYAFKPIIKREIRIPCIALIVFSSVYFVDFLAYIIARNSYNSLSSLVAMLIVSTVLLYRADEGSYKSTSFKNTMIDGAVSGISYLITVMIVGFFREFLAYGTIFEYSIGISGLSTDFAGIVGGLLIISIVAFIYNLITIPLRKKKKVYDSLVSKYSYYIEKKIAVGDNGSVEPDTNLKEEEEK